MNDDVAAHLTKAVNRLALVLEKRLAFDQEQAGLREREKEQAKTYRVKRTKGEA